MSKKQFKIKLNQNTRYRYGAETYLLGHEYSVNESTWEHLKESGKFTLVNVVEAKLKVKVDAAPEVEEEESGDEGLPNFRSKEDLANYALEEYGIEFEGSIKNFKMEDMRNRILETLALDAELAANEQEDEESKRGALAV